MDGIWERGKIQILRYIKNRKLENVFLNNCTKCTQGIVYFPSCLIGIFAIFQNIVKNSLLKLISLYRINDNINKLS